MEMGFPVMSPKRIATRYLRSWFAVDLISCIPVDQFIALMQRDKKVLNNRLRLVLLKPLGQALITSDVPPEPLRETLLAAT